MDKNKKATKAARAKAEEEALNHILYWIAGGSVLEFLLLLLNRYYFRFTGSEVDIMTALGVAVKILAVAGLLCAGAAFYWWNGAKKAGKNATLPGVLASLCWACRRAALPRGFSMARVSSLCMWRCLR